MCFFALFSLNLDSLFKFIHMLEICKIRIALLYLLYKKLCILENKI